MMAGDMTWETVFVFLLIGATFGFMVREKLTPDLVSMLALGVLLVAGILTPAEAFKVFSNDAVIAVACMFILSAALEQTGAIESVGRRLNRWVGPSDWSVLLVLLPIVAFLSAFINNTPVVVVFMPIMMSLAASRNLKPSRLLIPLSFVSILGGTCTLIGTSTNILVSSTAAQLGQPPLTMFELSQIGVPLAVVGLLYLLTVGRRLLPNRETLASLLSTTDSRQYLTEVVVVAQSPLIGKRLSDTPLKNLPNARVLEVIRGGETVAAPLSGLVLERGDRLRLTSVLSSVMEINALEGLEILPKATLGLEFVGAQKAVVVECVIGPRSDLIGHSIRETEFRRRYGAIVLAVHRQGTNLQEAFADVQLEYGDTLLIEGTEGSLRRLRESGDFLFLMDVPHTLPRRSKQGWALMVVGLVVALAALNVSSIATLAFLGAVAVVLLGCLDLEKAYDAVEWNVIFLIFGMLALGLALEKTKGTEIIANGILRGLGIWGPTVVLSAIVFLASLLTSFLSNNAVAVLLTPIAIQMGSALHLDPRPFLIAVIIGSSACFATPIGYQTNTLVYGAGGYLFRDFLKIGLPLNVVVWLLTTFLIPVFWPFNRL
ncbi:MAG: SLC13 family permease [Verrucomicrobia bacterium]|nr:SLC13 family permease [Verrucomicrobiota bacterium]